MLILPRFDFDRALRRAAHLIVSVLRLVNGKHISIWAALLLSLGSLALGHGVASAPDRGVAVLAGALPVSICLWVILRDKRDRLFLFRLFVAALALRWVVAFAIHDSGQEAFFGADATTYDVFGNLLKQSWLGLVDGQAPWLTRYTRLGSSGWGMFYSVASIYYLLGRNPLAIQLLNAGLGAGMCIAAYKIGAMVYPSQRVARIAALFSAFSPSMILWSSQGLKDAPIATCLLLCTLYTLRLREKFNVRSLLLLVLFLFCLFSLRHYAFYIVFVSIAGTLLMARRRFTLLQVFQGGLLVVVIGIAFVYLGAGDTAHEAFDLKRVQEFREWGAKVTNTGFGGDVDITDPRAAIGFLPIGILYVLLAPFPWMINNLRQLITLPELLAWWAMMPLVVKGYWFALRHRARESFTVLLFTVSLVCAYALYQSNAGTAYRHRAQLYPFFFVLIAIGMQLRAREKKLKSEAAPPEDLSPRSMIAYSPDLTKSASESIYGEATLDTACAGNQES